VEVPVGTLNKPHPMWDDLMTTRNYDAIRSGMQSAQRRAQKQAGVISRDQLMAYGIPDHVIERMLTSGGLHPLLPRIYAYPGTAATHDQRLWACKLWMGKRGFFSHETAAKLWRFPEIKSDLIHVTFRNRQQRPHQWIKVHSTLSVDRRDLTQIGSFPVSRAARTLLDLAAHLSEEILEVCVDHALLRGLTRFGGLERVLAESGGRGRRGAAALRKLLEVRGDVPPCASPLETRGARFLRKYRFPRPHRQFVVTHKETFVARVDFAYPERRLAIECDSVQWHAARARWENDRDRLNGMSRAEWQTFHLLSSRLKDDPDGLAAELRAIYRNRSPNLFD
jgi:very-short-patch-repair endonuclease